MQKILIMMFTSILFLSGCGGGDSDSGSSGGSGSSGDSGSSGGMVPGGTPSSPAVMSLSKRNEISSNSFHNYFIYNAKKGEKIYITAVLENPPSGNDITLCSLEGGVRHAQILNEDSVILTGTCTESLTYTFAADGTYTYKADYDSNGYFEADVSP